MDVLSFFFFKKIYSNCFILALCVCGVFAELLVERPPNTTRIVNVHKNVPGVLKVSAAQCVVAACALLSRTDVVVASSLRLLRCVEPEQHFGTVQRVVADVAHVG